MAQNGSNEKVANGLVALSSAAVLAVYAAGYSRTRSAAAQLEAQSAERRPAMPNSPRAAAPSPTAASAPGNTAPTPWPIASPAMPPAADKPGAIAVAHDLPPVVAAPTAETTLTQAAAEGLDKADLTAAAPADPSPKPVPPPPEVKADNTPAAVVIPPPASPSVTPPAAPAPAAPTWKDGTYTGWGTSRHGDIQASVTIEGGRIASATIAQCLTRYSCSVIARLPPEVPQRQSADVDYVSGATQSANAFYYAVVEALGKAK